MGKRAPTAIFNLGYNYNEVFSHVYDETSYDAFREKEKFKKINGILRSNSRVNSWQG